MRTWFLSLVFVTSVLGLLVGMQVKLLEVPEPVLPPDARISSLSAELSDLNRQKESLEQEIADLESNIDSARQGFGQAETALQSEITKHKIWAGLMELEGPGVILSIEDLPGGDHVFALRDEDLLRVINEMRSAGAEAIAINEQRVVSTTAIRQAGPFINVNLERISPPYQISAIGNSEKLRKELEREGGVIDTAQYLGMKIDITVHNELKLPAYVGDIEPLYMQPLREGV